MAKRPSFIPEKADTSADVAADSEQARLALALVDCRKRKEDLEDELKACNKELEAVSVALGTHLDAHGVQNFKLAGVGTFYVKNVARISTPEHSQPALCAWMKANGHGGLVKEAVHHKTLESWVAEQRELQQPMPDIISIFDQKRGFFRKS